MIIHCHYLILYFICINMNLNFIHIPLLFSIIFPQNILFVMCIFSVIRVIFTRHALVKSVRIRSFSGPYFPPFGLNMEIYSANLHIQSECGNIRTRQTPNRDTFHDNVQSSSALHRQHMQILIKEDTE